MEPLSWCEIDRQALSHNLRELRRVTGPGPLFAPVVKANAYGHGLALASRAFVAAGADWLCVNELSEAVALRGAGITVPILVVGHVPRADMATAAELSLRVVVYDRGAVDAAGEAGRRFGRPVPLHVKVETGNNRQGLPHEEALALARHVSSTPGVVLEGASTHFADIEDTTDHSFAESQLARFVELVTACRAEGMALPVCHCANSAAAILWPRAAFDMVRVGLAAYGMWPSKETYISALEAHRHDLSLTPALTWKTRIAQVKSVPAGSFVGYGRTFQTTHDTLLAVLPIGYYDGYDRRLSNQAHVLIDGHRAPVRGRVCMDFVMVDVTDVPAVHPEQEVVLLGGSGPARLHAEQLAAWIGTINYEVTTRIHERIPRVEV